jgi:predicted HicB family RNase H-like nuclease
MSRTPTLTKPKKITANLETALHEQATERAGQYGFSFSEYVSRLLVADLKRKRGIAHLVARGISA